MESMSQRDYVLQYAACLADQDDLRLRMKALAASAQHELNLDPSELGALAKAHRSQTGQLMQQTLQRRLTLFQSAFGDNASLGDNAL